MRPCDESELQFGSAVGMAVLYFAASIFPNVAVVDVLLGCDGWRAYACVGYFFC